MEYHIATAFGLGKNKAFTLLLSCCYNINMKKRYWLWFGITFTLITLVILYIPAGQRPSDPLGSLLNMVLMFVYYFPIGYFIMLILGFLSFMVFPPMYLMIPIVPAFLNGVFWGWLYGKIKNKNIVYNNNYENN